MLQTHERPSEDDFSARTLQTLEPCPGSPNTQHIPNPLVLSLQADRARRLRFLRSRLPSLEDAEDALQDTALKFLQASDHDGAAIEHPDAWVDASLRRIVIDRYRRAAVHHRMRQALAAAALLDNRPEDRDDALTAAQCLKETLPRLKTEYAEILALVYLQDHPLRDVAPRLGLTANNAAVRLHRARAALKGRLRVKCQSCPLADCCWARSRSGAGSAARPAWNARRPQTHERPVAGPVVERELST